MTPVTVQEPAKKEDKKNKKGLLAQLLSLFGKGGAAASSAAASTGAAGAAAGGMTAAQVAVAGGATAGGGWLTYLTTTKGLVGVLGGGAILVSVGMLGSQMMGGPGMHALGGAGFSAQQRAARNVDQADQPASGLQSYNEGIKAQGENDDDKDKAAKQSVGDAAPGAAAIAAPHHAAPTDAYGNPLSALKSGFGDSSNLAGGFGGGGGGGGGASKAGASGLAVTGGSAGIGAGPHGASTAMRNTSNSVVSSTRGRAVTGASGSLTNLKAAAGLSTAARGTSNYQTASYTAGRAFHGTTGAAGANSALTSGGAVVGGAGLTGAAANLASNPNTIAKNISPPTAPPAAAPNQSCSGGNPVEPDAASAGITQDQYNVLVTQCANQQQLVTDLLWLLGFAAASLIGIGYLSRSGPYGKIGAFVAAGALTLLVAGMLIGKPHSLFGNGLINIMTQTPSLMMFALLETAGAAFVTGYAWYAAATGNTVFGDNPANAAKGPTATTTTTTSTTPATNAATPASSTPATGTPATGTPATTAPATSAPAATGPTSSTTTTTATDMGDGTTQTVAKTVSSDGSTKLVTTTAPTVTSSGSSWVGGAATSVGTGVATSAISGAISGGSGSGAGAAATANSNQAQAAAAKPSSSSGSGGSGSGSGASAPSVAAAAPAPSSAAPAAAAPQTIAGTGMDVNAQLDAILSPGGNTSVPNSTPATSAPSFASASPVSPGAPTLADASLAPSPTAVPGGVPSGVSTPFPPANSPPILPPNPGGGALASLFDGASKAANNS